MLVEALLSEPSIEAFDQGVVRRRATAREGEFDAVFISPSIHDLARKLASIVDLDSRWQATLRNQPSHRLCHALPAQRLIYDNAKALLREVIDDGQRPESTSIKQRVTDEIHSP